MENWGGLERTFQIEARVYARGCPERPGIIQEMKGAQQAWADEMVGVYIGD